MDKIVAMESKENHGRDLFHKGERGRLHDHHEEKKGILWKAFNDHVIWLR